MSKKFGTKWGVHSDIYSMGEIKDLYEQTKLDGNFQRHGGYYKGSGWTKNQGQSYIEHFVRGETFNNVIVVDVERSVLVSPSYIKIGIRISKVSALKALA